MVTLELSQEQIKTILAALEIAEAWTKERRFVLLMKVIQGVL